MRNLLSFATLAIASVVLSACGGSNSSDTSTSFPSYKVSVVNLTNNQPMSPIAVVAHTSAYSAWAIGSPASNGLEQMAEGGDNTAFITSELDGRDAVAKSGAGVIPPGGNETVTITTSSSSQNRLTIASMFVNTNDAYVGLGSMDVSGLASGDSLSLTAPVYDAGTEANSEAAGTIPGPADGGTGFDAARDDVSDRVSRHAGVVSSDDGLTASVLDQSHRFDNPGMRLTITRQ